MYPPMLESLNRELGVDPYSGGLLVTVIPQGLKFEMPLTKMLGRFTCTHNWELSRYIELSYQHRQ